MRQFFNFFFSDEDIRFIVVLLLLYYNVRTTRIHTRRTRSLHFTIYDLRGQLRILVSKNLKIVFNSSKSYEQ